MPSIGQRSTLAIVRESTPGLYLDGQELGEILLPRRYIPRNVAPKDKLDATSASDIETAIAESKTALGGSDVDAMNNAFERLQTASHKLAEVLYSSQTQGGGEAAAGEQASSASAGAESGDSGSTASADDNVIDAEYVDVEDEKK